MVPVKKSTLAIVIAIVILLSSAFGFCGALAANHFFPPMVVKHTEVSQTDAPKATPNNTSGNALSVQEITEKAQASVVEIKTEAVITDPWMQQYVTEGAGSGVVYKSDGYILTNNHVIEGAGKIKVTTSNKKVYEAELVSTDPDTDVAVLKVKAKGLTAASIGNSDQLQVGDLAVAIGNPLGELGGTVTAGIISALDRSLSIGGKTMSLLQTDTSINPGNSGGGLFNQYGQLIGLVVAKSAGSNIEGLGFAIPVNRVVDVADQLIKTGYVKGKVTTGMSYADMSSQQNGFGSLFDQFWGNGEPEGALYIHEVIGSNAKKAGFKQGDIVYSVDGTRIDSFETLSSIITSHKVGDVVKYVVLRDGTRMSLSLKLAEKTAP